MSSPKRLLLDSVTFSVMRKSDGEAVWNFLNDHFFPDEPVMRSSRMLDRNSCFYPYYRYELYKYYIHKMVHFGKSFVARDPEGNIVAICLGYAAHSTDDERTKSLYSDVGIAHYLDYVPTAIMPSSIFKAFLTIKLISEVRYDPLLVFEDLKCSRLFVCDVVCVAKLARGLGLGKVILRRSMLEARSSGCEFYFAFVTGLYSQAIFESCDFGVVRKVRYDEYVDDYGQPVVDLAGEHTHAQTVSRTLGDLHQDQEES